MSEHVALEALRREFDSGFATEPAARTQRVDLLALRVGGGPFAVRVSELAGVVPFHAVAPLPCDDRAMLGIAAVRGAALPVYDLATLLGREASASTRWMLLSAGAGYFMVARSGFNRRAAARSVAARARSPVFS